MVHNREKVNLGPVVFAAPVLIRRGWDLDGLVEEGQPDRRHAIDEFLVCAGMVQPIDGQFEQGKDDPQAQFRIVNTGSISSYTSSPSRGEYCISKAGIRMMTLLYADRLAEYGIGVFEVSPGIIQTDMTAAVKDKYDKLIADGLTPIKRWGQPEDIAKVVGAIAEGRLDFSTGTAIDVDGGFHIRRL